MNSLGLAALVTTVVVGAAVFSTYRRKLNKLYQRVTEGGKIVETKVGPIEYGEVGSGAPVLVIHGAGGGCDQGLLLAQSFPQFRVIAPSRFGYLRTGPYESILCDTGGGPCSFA